MVIERNLVVVMTMTMPLVSGFREVRAQEGIKYDARELRNYTQRQLLQLLTDASVTLNISAFHIVKVFPSHWDQKTNHRDSYVNRSRTAFISVDTNEASYLETVANEIVRRDTPVEALVHVFDTTSDPIQFRWMEHIITRLRSFHSDSLMQSLLKSGELDTDKSFLVLMYFAKAGTRWALHDLNCNYSAWPISSDERSDLARLFGLHRYIPAGRNMVESLDAASVYLQSAAMTALDSMYPELSRAFSTKDEAREYWSTHLPPSIAC